MPRDAQLLPQDANERAFWEQQVKDAYYSGREQAQEVFDNNLSTLEEVYTGMRVFYDLYQRNMVSAPVIAKSQEIVTQDDPNTIVVGDTLFRITMPSQFKMDPSKWTATSATPSYDRPLDEIPGYDSSQISVAYDEYKKQMARKEAQAIAKKMGVKNVDVEPAEPEESDNAILMNQSNSKKKSGDKQSDTDLTIAVPVADITSATSTTSPAQPIRIGLSASESEQAIASSVDSEKKAPYKAPYKATTSTSTGGQSAPAAYAPPLFATPSK
jgi:hypothetical protein